MLQINALAGRATSLSCLVLECLNWKGLNEFSLTQMVTGLGLRQLTSVCLFYTLISTNPGMETEGVQFQLLRVFGNESDFYILSI